MTMAPTGDPPQTAAPPPDALDRADVPISENTARWTAVVLAALLASVGVVIAAIAGGYGATELNDVCNDTTAIRWTCPEWRTIAAEMVPVPLVFAAVVLVGIGLATRSRTAILAWTGAAVGLCAAEAVAWFVAIP